MRLSNKSLTLSIVATLFICLSCPATARSLYVRNGGCGQKGAAPSLTQEVINNLRSQGWHCPDREGWPTWWSGGGSNMRLEYMEKGGKENDRYIRIGGKDGYINVYHGTPLESNKVYRFWLRGKGTLRAGYHAWKLNEDNSLAGQIHLPPIIVKVNSKKWVRYRHSLIKPDHGVTLHPAFAVLEGIIDLDEVDIEPSNAALDLIVAEEEKLYGTGALIENLNLAQADETFKKKAAEFKSALEDFEAKSGTLDKNLVLSLKKNIETLKPYVLSEGISAVQVPRYNEMIAMTRVLNRLTKKKVGEAAKIRASEAAPSAPITHKPGVRESRPGKITITDVHSNKVCYDENQRASTIATVVNAGKTPASGTLIARMILDLDTVREITRAGFNVGAGQEKKWSFSYSVGPETYGRAIEVQFVGSDGKTLDSHQEYYAVAAEYFRVQQPTYEGTNKLYEITPWTTYYNQRHYFAHEPTDAGVHSFDAEQYLSGQVGYRINEKLRSAEIKYFTSRGTSCSFYQTFAFCGIQGYEVMRRYPEFVLYDDNGQFAVDPVYGGYPNPIELASPIEIGPKRKGMKIKPYLDRQYTPWQHTPGNWASEDLVVFQSNRIKEYAKLKEFKGIYWDGNLGIWKGYAYDGKPNVPSGKPEDYIRLNARNHRIYSEILKKDDPNFGTWYNWGKKGVDSYIRQGLTFYYGSGSGMMGDESDDAIRTALDYKNVMILDERHGCFGPGDGVVRYPDKLLASLLEQRDFIVQKYGGNTIFGYDNPRLKAEEPGPSKWGWPAVNYLMAQLTATQHHYVGAFYPSYRPQIQFQTRHSRFIWAPDIKAVPVEDVEKIVQLETPEKIWWKRLVYKRKTDDGCDLIIHLVRIPPTEKFDINWVDEPAPLEGVKISADIVAGRLQTAQACRPYYFEEEQQVVQKVLDAKVEGGKATVEIPPFRYHTMVVLRLKE